MPPAQEIPRLRKLALHQYQSVRIEAMHNFCFFVKIMQEKVKKEKSLYGYGSLAIFPLWRRRITALRGGVGSEELDLAIWLQVEASQWVRLIEKNTKEAPHSAGKIRLLKLMQAIVYKIFQTIYVLDIVKDNKRSFFLHLSDVEKALDEPESQITDINGILKKLYEQLPLVIRAKAAVKAKESMHTTGCKITRWLQRLWNKDANPGDKLKGDALFDTIKKFPELAHEVLKDREWFDGKNLWTELSNEQVFDLYSMNNEEVRKAILNNNNPAFHVKVFYGIRGVIEQLQDALQNKGDQKRFPLTNNEKLHNTTLWERLQRLCPPEGHRRKKAKTLFLGPHSLWRDPKGGEDWWNMLESRMDAYNSCAKTVAEKKRDPVSQFASVHPVFPETFLSMQQLKPWV